MGLNRLRGDWPLVGRAEELAELVAVVQQGVDQPDRPCGAVVAATAGVGKTRLLHEVRKAAEELGVPTATVIATQSGAKIPYGAMAHLLPALPTAADTDQVAWFNQFAEHLRRTEGPRPVLLVDDAHWLDPGSAALVLHLTLTGAATVVAAIRRGEAAPDPITALWRDGLAARVDIQPCTRREVEQLIGLALGGQVATRTARRLAEVSQGNILFARELVIGAVEAGSLRERDRVWQWDGELVLAPRLLDAVGARLGGLDAAARETLALVAVGEPLLVHVLERVADPLSIARLEAAGLVRVEGTGRQTVCRVGHPLYGEVLLGQVGRIERRRLTGVLAEILEADADRTPSAVVQVATWLLENGDTSSPELLSEAAVLASQSFDHALAERLANAALDAGAGPLAAVTLAQAYFGLGRFKEAEVALTHAEPAVLESDDPDLHQLYLDRCNSVFYLGLRRREETLAALERFRQAQAGATGRRARQARGLADAYRATLLNDAGQLADTLALTEPVAADPDAGELATGFALSTGAEAMAYQGRTRTARRRHASMRELARSGSPEVHTVESRADLQEVLCLVTEGRATEAVRRAEELHDQRADTPDRSVGALLPLAYGAALLLQGSVGRAQRLLREAVLGYRELDVGGALSWSLSMVAQAAALAGDHESASDLWAESLDARPPYRVARAEADFVAAESLVQLSAGDATGAARIAREGADRLGELVMPRIHLLHLAFRLGFPAGPIASEIAGLSHGTESDLPQLVYDHVHGVASRDGELLDTVTARFTDRGLWLYAAEAAARASHIHAEAGERAAASRASRRSAELADRLEGARTPALAQTAPARRLSRREAEVARLAAEGLSNAAIADRLTLSVRTVESHLYNAFAKLGVDQREDLADALAIRE